MSMGTADAGVGQEERAELREAVRRCLAKRCGEADVRRGAALADIALIGDAGQMVSPAR